METIQNYNLYCGLVENEDELFDVDGENVELKLKHLKSRMQAKKHGNKRKKSKNSCSSYKSEKSEPERGRTKSCNEDDDLLFDSNKYFDSLQHFQMTDTTMATSSPFKSSNPSLSFLQTSHKSPAHLASGKLEYSENNLTSANNGANLFVLLAANRNKAKTAAKTMNSSSEKIDAKNTPVKVGLETNFLSPTTTSRLLDINKKHMCRNLIHSYLDIVPSLSLNNDLLGASSFQDGNEPTSFIRQTSHEPISKTANAKNVDGSGANSNRGPVSSVSVSTTNTSDSNITTSHSLNLPQSMLESMSQVSSNYSIDKSSSTLPTRGAESVVTDTETNRSSLKKSSANLMKKKSLKNDIELEEGEESDVLNEIFKVNQWLTDNHRNKSVLLSQLLSESQNNEEDEDSEEDQIVPNSEPIGSSSSGNKGSSGENNDSAIDISSYGSISNLSKTSSKKTRVKWQSFTKYYRLNLQHNSKDLSKYQISAMSCEELMMLRKLALSQFSKLLERQHSSMIR